MTGDALVDTELLKEILKQGGGVLAAFILALFYRKDMKGVAARWRESAKRSEQQADTIILVIKENTVAFTRAVAAMDATQKQLAGMEARWDGVTERRGGRRAT